jgi:internalin A
MAGSSGFGGHRAVECADPLTFPDRALEANVRLNINRPSGDIHPSDVAMLADLAASGGDVRGQIRDLSGIECLTGLVYVRLNDNQIADVRPLAGLSSCRLLNLANNNVIADVTPLASLARLNTLDLSGNRLANVVPLGALAELEELDLSRNQVSDLGPLGKLGQLHTLKLNFNPVANLSALATLLPHLDDLSLTGTGLSSLTLLVGPPGLRCGGTLWVFNNPFDCSTEAANLRLLRQRCDYVGTDCP